MAGTVNLEAEPVRLEGALLLRPPVFRDDRGLFQESYVQTKYRDLGIRDDFVQDNVAVSKRGVLRGLHCDPAMTKLVQVLHGKAFDVIVDTRKGSPTFGQWQGFELSDQNRFQLYVPRGFLHGYLSLSDETVFCYKQSAEYNASREIGVMWDDPKLGIIWPIAQAPMLSAKDAANKSFSAAFGDGQFRGGV